nr:acyltransferase domain-containing protein [Actinoplanes couchii]
MAALNGPESTVVSGPTVGLDGLLALCESRGVQARRIDVDYASHNEQVEVVEAELAEVLAGVSPRSGGVEFWSTVRGERVDGSELGAGYWFENVRRPVLFAPVVEGLVGAGFSRFVEVSPHPVLVGGVRDVVGDRGCVVGSLRRDDGGWDRLLSSAAEAFVAGVPVDWSRVVPAAGLVELPTYAFQRERFWMPSSQSAGSGDVAGMGHPLLGGVLTLADGAGWVFTGRLSVAGQPWLADHAVDGTVLVPGVGLAELLLAAGERAGFSVIGEVTLEAPLLLGDGPVQVQVRVTEDGEASVHARRGDDGEWVRHARASLIADSSAEPSWAWTTSWPPPSQRMNPPTRRCSPLVTSTDRRFRG